MKERAVPEQRHVALGTIWPRPRVYHVPATNEVLETLIRIMQHHAGQNWRFTSTSTGWDE